MARIRKGVAYRRLERPYTRKSKFRKKSFIRASPNIKVVRYDMGNLTKKFPFTVFLRSKQNIQIRHNAIESARLSSNRLLEAAVGKPNFHMKIRIYPHHVLRENPLASGAGADRMSTGMKMSFGKPIGNAARVRENQILFEINTEKQFLDQAKKAFGRVKHKLPCSCYLEVVENK